MSRAAPWLAAAAGAALVGTGIALFTRANAAAAAGFGWYAYIPLAADQAYDSRLDVQFDSWFVLWTTGHLVGLSLLTLGLLLVVGTAGRELGRRTVRGDGGVPRRALAAGAAGSLLVLAGIGAALTSTSGQTPGTVLGGVVLTAAPLAGLGVAVVGALLLSGVSGWLLGREQRVDQG